MKVEQIMLKMGEMSIFEDQKKCKINFIRELERFEVDKKELVDENSVLKTKIIRLEKKVKVYKEERFNKLQEGNIFSDTLNFAIKKKKKSAEKHSKSVMNKYEKVKENNWMKSSNLNVRKVKEKILESDDSNLHQEIKPNSKDFDDIKSDTQMSNDNHLFERIRQLEVAILKKKEKNYPNPNIKRVK
mmetsp:Transcript_20892/g.18520  ORF Transcript_20892/g.18520 Transcript_20892/m.18520 type:complete len:187 (+) Transcript_20892:166-726(+)